MGNKECCSAHLDGAPSLPFKCPGLCQFLSQRSHSINKGVSRANRHGLCPQQFQGRFSWSLKTIKTPNVLLGAWVLLKQNQVPQNYVLNAGLELSDFFFESAEHS